MRGHKFLTVVAGAALLCLGLVGPARVWADTPMDAIENLENVGKMLFKLADTNNDNMISQQEATDAGNLMVGGFFFRADVNGDGKVTKEEGKAARESLFTQRPLFRFIFERAKSEIDQEAARSKQPVPKLVDLLDGNHDSDVTATELRQAVASGVQTLFITADANRDQQLEPAEFNKAVVEIGRTAAQATFNAADKDSNGAISRNEFDQAIVGPAHVVFGILDANKDNQLSAEEMRNGGKILIRELQGLLVPEAPNSLSNLIEQSQRSAASTVRPAPAPVATPATAQPLQTAPVPGQATSTTVDPPRR